VLRRADGPLNTFIVSAEKNSIRTEAFHDSRSVSSKDYAMSKKLVRYRVKPEKIEENQQLIERVFRELHAKSPSDVRYLVIKLSDGTFFHLFEDGSRTIPTLDAFAAFRDGGEQRRLDEPQQLEATVVGNYRTLVET
jgi:hypothetical protein